MTHGKPCIKVPACRTHGKPCVNMYVVGFVYKMGGYNQFIEEKQKGKEKEKEKGQKGKKEREREG